LGEDGSFLTEVSPGDILVGKIRQNRKQSSLLKSAFLRAIFGEKAADVKDASLKLLLD